LLLQTAWSTSQPTVGDVKTRLALVWLTTSPHPLGSVADRWRIIILLQLISCVWEGTYRARNAQHTHGRRQHFVLLEGGKEAKGGACDFFHSLGQCRVQREHQREAGRERVHSWKIKTSILEFPPVGKGFRMGDGESAGNIRLGR
jgi:hypothetical protein